MVIIVTSALSCPALHSFMLLHQVSPILPVFLTLNNAFLHYMPGSLKMVLKSDMILLGPPKCNASFTHNKCGYYIIVTLSDHLSAHLTSILTLISMSSSSTKCHSFTSECSAMFEMPLIMTMPNLLIGH